MRRLVLFLMLSIGIAISGCTSVTLPPETRSSDPYIKAGSKKDKIPGSMPCDWVLTCKDHYLDLIKNYKNCSE